MGFRFRRNISLFPGVRINLSKGGVSASFGAPGATINLGKHGLRGTVGLPGSGLSYTKFLSKRGQKAETAEPADPAVESGAPGASFGGRALVAMVVTLGALLVMGLALDTPGKLPPDSGSAKVLGDSRPTAAISSNSMTVRVRVANCRGGPSTSNRVIVQLARERLVQVQEKYAEWYRVKAGSLNCWVNKSLVK